MTHEYLPETELRVRFFGALELENSLGCVSENRSKPTALNWMTLKYLLCNCNREVGQDELLSLEFPGKSVAVPDGAMRTRLRRVRDLLKPLSLGSMHGLVLYSDGKYFINPEITLLSDEDAFNNLLRRIRALPEDEPAALALCTEALELMRGAFLAYSGDGEWLAPYREHYRREFAALAEETLRRMRALDSDEPAGLVWRRAIAVAPENEALHRAIVAFLVERRLESELLRYVSQLTLGGAAWLREFAY